MAIVRVENVRMAGLASSVPDFVRTVDDDVERFQSEDFRKIGESIGVTSRRIAPEGVCASDLCVAAAERLLDELDWDRDSIRAVLFVTQTPDYPAPATACTLQSRLGLSTNCAAMDINLGCSGYVYGLATAAQFVQGMAGGQENGGRVLLLVGDTITHFVSPDDRATAPLFGDAGSATALEFSSAAEPIVFSLGTDGRGLNHLIVPAGGARQPRTEETGVRTPRESGNIRSDEDMYMNGAEVFSFALQEVPKMVRSTLAEAGWTIDEVDGVVMHQSNGIMLKHLRKRLKVDKENFVIALEGYGNASCASIPLAMTHQWAQAGRSKKRKLVLAGFGLGWSWGGAAVTCENMVMPDLVIYETPQRDGAADLVAKEAA
jgi:3-oxoacyl-[acyl-carrier-protein] synthase-3